MIIEAGEEITEEIADRIDETSIESIEIRSALTCETKTGICAKCYGRNLASGRMVDAGEAVGVIASQSIGEPGTQLTLRTFHTGGTAMNVSVEANIKAKFSGKLDFEDIKTVESIDKEGNPATIVIGRRGEVRIIDEATKQILISNIVPYGSTLSVKDGQKLIKVMQYVTGISLTLSFFLILTELQYMMLSKKVSHSVKKQMSRLVSVIKLSQTLKTELKTHLS